MISLTAKAKQKIVEISQAEGIGHNIVRAKIMGGGCAGFSYDMSFDDKILDTDEVIEDGDVKIIIDPLSHQYLDGATIDWQDGLIGAGFKFNNPNATGSCGCGHSVTF